MLNPYHQERGITIYNAQAEDILPHLDMAALCLTDPPYGHSDKWQGGTWGEQKIVKDALTWDDTTISNELLQLVLNSASYTCLWGGNYYRLPPSRCWLAWCKPHLPTLADAELAWTNLDAPLRVWHGGRSHEEKYHAAQKPVALMKWCIHQFPPTDTILDPFMGSGTTLVAAKHAGLRAIGIDRSEEYCAIAVERLRQEQLNFAATQI